MSSKWIPTKEAAALWGVHPKTIRRWVNKGKISGCKLGPRTMRVEIAEDDDGVQETANQEVEARPCQ